MEKSEGASDSACGKLAGGKPCGASDSAQGKSWGAWKEQLSKLDLGEQPRVGSIQPLCHILNQRRSLTASPP